MRQQQFLEVVDRDEAERRWREVIDGGSLPAESVPLDAALGRVLDSRPGEKDRYFDGEAMFPLGMWKRGEQREFEYMEFTPSGPRKRVATIKIRRLDYTYKGVERIIRAAFTYATQRGRSRVTLVDKANALPQAGGLWRRVFDEVGSEFTGLERDTMYVDAMAMDLVRRPETYDVVVTSNLFGDILSDLAAEVTGGLGLAPSANLNPGTWALFEPVHGSAPDIAGTGTANPMAAIKCVSLLFEHLGEDGAADAVVTALVAALDQDVTAPDLGGRATTEEVGRWVADHLAAMRS